MQCTRVRCNVAGFVRLNLIMRQPGIWLRSKLADVRTTVASDKITKVLPLNIRTHVPTCM